jgi:uncharacterized membrane protein HdeD (DUF308 family)
MDAEATMSSTHPTGTASTLRLSVGAEAAYGVLLAALGLVLLFWPRATLVVALVVFAVQLFVSAVMNVVRAVMSDIPAAERALLGLDAALSTLVGFLVLRSPLQSLLIGSLLIGAWWVIRGVVDLFAAATGAEVRRGLAVLKGLLSVGAGGFVLVNPGISLTTMIFVVGAWLLVYGIVGTAVAFLSRRSP